MAERETAGGGAVSLSNQLMSETDAEHGILTAQSSDRSDDTGHIRGITGAVGNQNSIRLQGLNDLSGCVIGNNGNIAAARIQASDDAMADTAVDRNDVVLVV